MRSKYESTLKLYVYPKTPDNGQSRRLLSSLADIQYARRITVLIPEPTDPVLGP